jgi:bifunctional non-homologous end joining protein LigD
MPTFKKPSQDKKPCEGARPAQLPSHINPMLATLIDKPFSDPEWLFETKWDGARAICFIHGGTARFISRNQLEMTAQYPELATITQCIAARQAILDGEIVALDERGVSRFQLLQPRLGRKNPLEIQRLAQQSRIVYYVFDLLYYDGWDLTSCRLLDRKTVLERVLNESNNVRYSEHIIGAGEELYRQVARIPLEGMVAKRLDSHYVQKRSRNWLKVKTIQEIEVVVGGYTQPRGSRDFFGSLVVGLYRGRKLHYVAHIGGGFSQRTLSQLYELMQTLRTDRSPFAAAPQTNEPVQWLQPKLVVQVKFAEWTAEGHLRQPIFLGLREDKKAGEATFESAHPTAEIIEPTQGKRSRK